MGFNMDYKAIYNAAMKSDGSFHPLSGEELAKLQDCLYHMMVDLDVRCRKYGIKLFLVGGSLLGAVRHKGFIPWDDDVDFGASREDYEKLKVIFDGEFSGEYELRCPNTEHPSGGRFMKIYKKGTVLDTGGKGNPFVPNCVKIDVFPYDHVPENKLCRKIKGSYTNFLMLVASCVMDRKYGDDTILFENTKDGKLYLRARRAIGTVFSFIRPEKWFDIVDRAAYFKKKTSLITSAFGSRHYFGEISRYSVFFPLDEMSFLDHKFFAPADPGSYLTSLYGSDYMTPPEESKRESHYIRHFSA